MSTEAEAAAGSGASAACACGYFSLCLARSFLRREEPSAGDDATLGVLDLQGLVGRDEDALGSAAVVAGAEGEFAHEALGAAVVAGVAGLAAVEAVLSRASRMVTASHWLTCAYSGVSASGASTRRRPGRGGGRGGRRARRGER